MLRHLDLFSGIGGFSLAVDRTFGKSEHIFCEIDPFCVEVLKKHWPNSKIYGDIRTLTNTKSEQNRGLQQPRFQPHIGTILTGGFPCQPFSQAGRRQGTADDRYLWPEMFRVIREFKPTWVIAENVRGLVTWNEGMVLEQVCADLEAEGYEVQPLIIPAVGLNAPHRRERIWFIANRRSEESRGLSDIEREEIQSSGGRDKNAQNPISEQTEGYSGQRSGERGDKEQGSDAEDTFSIRSRGRLENSGQILGRKSTEVKDERPSWEENWVEVATRLCRVDDGLPRRLDRNPRLKALGNAIVPEVAEEVLKAIKKVW